LYRETIRAIGIEGLQPRAPNSVALTARIALNFGAQNQQDCLVDTTRIGDGNDGHIWGTDLADPTAWPFWNISRPTDARRRARQMSSVTGRHHGRAITVIQSATRQHDGG
jgi:hypothetical protein